MSSHIRAKLFKGIKQYFYTILVPPNNNNADIEKVQIL
jgi:hypothetical protein